MISFTGWDSRLDELMDVVIRRFHRLVFMDNAVLEDNERWCTCVEGLFDVLEKGVINDTESHLILILVKVVVEDSHGACGKRIRIVLGPRDILSNRDDPCYLTCEPLTSPSVHNEFVIVLCIDLSHVFRATTSVCKAILIVLCFFLGKHSFAGIIEFVHKLSIVNQRFVSRLSCCISKEPAEAEERDK